MTTACVPLSAVVAAMNLTARGGARVPPPPPTSFSTRLGRAWYTVPQPLRYFVSGNCGNVLFYACERLAYHFLSSQKDLPEWAEKYKDSLSFLSGYLLHIVGQHYLHALLVYGLESIDTPEKYWATLRGLYSALITAAIGSTILNSMLLEWGMARTPAFITTLWVFAFINYLWIGWIVKRSTEKADKRKKNLSRTYRGGEIYVVEETLSIEDWIRLSAGPPIQIEDSASVSIPPKLD